MPYFRKKPVVVEAIQFLDNVDSLIAIQKFTGFELRLTADRKLIIPTLEGDMEASVGDLIIKGVNGEFYPCKPDIFEQTYEPVK